MKEATGELNMTVVTLIAVAALGALFYFVVWPMVQRMVVQQTCNTYGPTWTAIRQGTIDNNSSAKIGQWYCCPAGEDGKPASSVSNDCIKASDEDDGGE